MTAAKPLQAGPRRVEGHVTTSGRVATAWYVVPWQPWSFRSETDCDNLIFQGAARYSELHGHRVHWRSTWRTQTPEQWRDHLNFAAVDPLPGLADHLAVGFARVAQLDCAEKVVFLGVDVQRRSSRWLLNALWSDRTVADIDRIVAGPGWRARPGNADEIEWLIRRSKELGHPSTPQSGSQEPWGESDVAESGDPYWWAEHAYSPTVISGYKGRTAHLAVTVAGRTIKALNSNSYGPWMCRADGLGFPVEVAATFDVLAPEDAERWVRRKISAASAQIAHYADRGKTSTLPPNLPIAEQRGLQIQAEMDDTELSTQLNGWVRWATYADTETECIRRAEEVRRRHARQIATCRPAGQYQLLRGFIPGEPVGMTAHRREIPAVNAAGGLPQVTARIGDESGFYLAYTEGDGGRHAAFWDPWASQRRNGPGLTLAVGELGGGKTWLAGRVAYEAALSGAIVAAIDASPAGLLGRLCDLPEFAGRSRRIDLLRARTPGQFSPWRLVPNPQRERFANREEWETACQMAGSYRRSLAVDYVAMMMNTPPTEDQRLDLFTAAQTADRSSCPSLYVMIEALSATQPRLANYLRLETAYHPAAQVFFDSAADTYESDGRPPVLTVVTLGDTQTPPATKPRAEWTDAERWGSMHMAASAWMLRETTLNVDRHHPKLTIFDEAKQLVRVPSGRMALELKAGDARKHTDRVVVIAHSVNELASVHLGPQLDSMFVFHTVDPDSQTAALAQGKIPTGCGFEADLATLADRDAIPERRDCVWIDGRGRAERCTIDRHAVAPHVQAALDSTADPSKAKRVVVDENADRVPA